MKKSFTPVVIMATSSIDRDRCRTELTRAGLKESSDFTIVGLELEEDHFTLEDFVVPDSEQLLVISMHTGDERDPLELASEMCKKNHLLKIRRFVTYLSGPGFIQKGDGQNFCSALVAEMFKLLPNLKT